MTERSPTPVTATYRVQLNADSTLARVRAGLADLERLGISHLYCSPVLAARPGSRHGYDVVDPARLNPEIGTEAEWGALADDLHRRGMGLVLDIVPNHMGIGPSNAYWEDVLTHGERSPWAHWFDIEWERRRGASGQAGGGRVVLPVLGDELDAVLARGELRLAVDAERVRLHYFDNSWPVDPATLPAELQLAQWDTEAVRDPTALVRDVEGESGLRALLDAQHYRLTFWRRVEEINYRRFFDVNDLAALRMDDPRVFEATHALVLRWVEDGVIDGLRIDHIDGLLDPKRYLERLRAEVSRRAPRAGGDFPIWVEKILSPGERLRDDWPVQGTTGYEFLNDLDDTLIDPAGFRTIERAYRAMRRMPDDETFARIAYRSKLAELNGPLRADVARLARLLAPLVELEGDALGGAIAHFIAGLPVYRTYIDARSPEPSDADLAVIGQAVERVRREAPDMWTAASLVGEVVLGRGRDIDPERWLDFVQRLQQTSGPAAAKGVEDTALYVYVPLASRNEVGGSPDRSLDEAVRRLHAANAERARAWPSSLLCTTTHDTKRSADVRARLDAVSYAPAMWDRCVGRWRKLNRKHKRVVRGRLAPDTNTEYLIYQTMVAIWPAPRPGRRSDDLPDRAWRDSAAHRLEEYALKAAREAKVCTSWTEPDAEFEQALSAFVAAILQPADEAPFLTDVARLVAEVVPRAHQATLARLLVHTTAPGVPDIYRGDERWAFTLVDPDNRRPIDRVRRRQLLDEVVPRGGSPGPELETLARDLADPRLKLFVVQRLLTARRQSPEPFVAGDYRPLDAVGDWENGEGGNLFAFCRSAGNRYAVAIARLPSTKSGADRTGGWGAGSKRLVLPDDVVRGMAGRRWWSVFDGEEIGGSGDGIEVARVLDAVPIALLLSR